MSWHPAGPSAQPGGEGEALVDEHRSGWRCANLGCLAIEESVVVASLKVDGDGAVWVGLHVAGQDLLRHVIVVKAVVAHGQVHIQRQQLPAVDRSTATKRGQPLVGVARHTSSPGAVSCIHLWLPGSVCGGSAWRPG